MCFLRKLLEISSTESQVKNKKRLTVGQDSFLWTHHKERNRTSCINWKNKRKNKLMDSLSCFKSTTPAGLLQLLT